VDVNAKKMIEIFLGLLTFLAASFQDYREMQVNVVFLLPYFLAVLSMESLISLFVGSLFVSVYYFVRNFKGLEIGLGTADLLLLVPTVFVFSQFDFLLVLIFLFFVPVVQSYLKKEGEGKVAAIPGMTLGFIVLLIASLLL